MEPLVYVVVFEGVDVPGHGAAPRHDALLVHGLLVGLDPRHEALLVHEPLLVE
jgi:hypothetical protein